MQSKWNKHSANEVINFTAANTARPTTKFKWTLLIRKAETTRWQAKKTQCGKCGSWNTRQPPCPAIGTKCHKCGQRNHFARVCHSNPRKADKPRLHTIDQNSSDKDNGMYIATINGKSDTKDWEVNIKMNEQRVTFKIDPVQCHLEENLRQSEQTTPNEITGKANSIWGHRVSACGKAVIAKKSTYRLNSKWLSTTPLVCSGWKHALRWN